MACHLAYLFSYLLLDCVQLGLWEVGFTVFFKHAEGNLSHFKFAQVLLIFFRHHTFDTWGGNRTVVTLFLSLQEWHGSLIHRNLKSWPFAHKVRAQCIHHAERLFLNWFLFRLLLFRGVRKILVFTEKLRQFGFHATGRRGLKLFGICFFIRNFVEMDVLLGFWKSTTLSLTRHCAERKVLRINSLWRVWVQLRCQLWAWLRVIWKGRVGMWEHW